MDRDTVKLILSDGVSILGHRHKPQITAIIKAQKYILHGSFFEFRAGLLFIVLYFQTMLTLKLSSKKFTPRVTPAGFFRGFTNTVI